MTREAQGRRRGEEVGHLPEKEVKWRSENTLGQTGARCLRLLDPGLRVDGPGSPTHTRFQPWHLVGLVLDLNAVEILPWGA